MSTAHLRACSVPYGAIIAEASSAAQAYTAAGGGGGGDCPVGLWHCCCEINVTLFSCVTLIRKQQSTSDLNHFRTRELPCSRVKSCDDSISGRRGDSAVPYSFIYRDSLQHLFL